MVVLPEEGRNERRVSLKGGRGKEGKEERDELSYRRACRERRTSQFSRMNGSGEGDCTHHVESLKEGEKGEGREGEMMGVWSS